MRVPYIHVRSRDLGVQQAFNLLIDYLNMIPDSVASVANLDWLVNWLKGRSGCCGPRIVAGIIQPAQTQPFPAYAIATRVTFDVPFLDDQYALVTQIVGGNGDYMSLRVLQKTAKGFTVLLKSNGASKPCDWIDFIAREAVLEEFGGYSGSAVPSKAGGFMVRSVSLKDLP
jgi:hypothetical protein